MASPFSSFNTYTLFFEVETEHGRLVEDPNTGLKFPLAQSEPLKITCTLKQGWTKGSKTRESVANDTGANQTLYDMNGRMVSPMKMPPQIGPGSKAKVEIGGEDFEFELLYAHPDGHPAVTKALGDKIAGRLRLVKS
jgi:hypothetical protein